MSCEFKPGDEVVCVSHDADDGCGMIPFPPIGHIGSITSIGEGHGGFWMTLHNWPTHPAVALEAENFRKVQKRDLTAWLGQTTTFEEPKRVRSPA